MTGAVVVVLCAGLAFAAVPAIGQPANTKVRFRIGFTTQEGKPFFSGRLVSARKSCMRFRRVNVFRHRGGNRTNIYIAGGRSDRTGRWRTKAFSRLRTGGYFAYVKPKPGCRAGRSVMLAAGQDSRFGGRAPGSGYP